jgi:hypothetical protein
MYKIGYAKRGALPRFVINSPALKSSMTCGINSSGRMITPSGRANPRFGALADVFPPDDLFDFA